jgi:N-acetylglucosamine-6-sulfatase
MHVHRTVSSVRVGLLVLALLVAGRIVEVSSQSAPGATEAKFGHGGGSGTSGVVVASTTGPGAAASGLVTTSATRRPNIVLILTDDQRWDTLWAMPNVHALLQKHGVTFQNAFVTNSLCCPSRTTILTGKYSHSTGVYGNILPHGGFRAFHDRTTIATVLDAAGYRTALIGKYLNAYGGAAHRGYIPPGWDRWFAFAEDNAHYYDYEMTDEGRIRHYGSSPSDYATNVLANKAVTFIRRTTGPLFLYFAPPAPHQIATPAPRDVTAFADLHLGWPPNFDEADVSDKPAWVRAAGLRGQAVVAAVRRHQYQTLLAVDRAVARIVGALRDTGRLSTTLIVFMGDNGYLWGEHRLGDKRAVYEESIRVPMVIRYDPITRSARLDDHLVLNMDLAPTWAALVGRTMPGANGRSLLPLLRSSTAPWRNEFLIEHLKDNEGDPITRSDPTYCAIRTMRFKYVLYQTREQELYDLRADPYELQNLARVSRFQSWRLSLRRRLNHLCRPRPPGFTAFG